MSRIDALSPLHRQMHADTHLDLVSKAIKSTKEPFIKEGKAQQVPETKVASGELRGFSESEKSKS